MARVRINLTDEQHELLLKLAERLHMSVEDTLLHVLRLCWALRDRQPKQTDKHPFMEMLEP